MITKLYYTDAADISLTEKEAECLFFSLSDTRREKIKKCGSKRARQESFAAGLLTLYGLRDCGFSQRREPEPSFGPGGKPYFSDLPELFFNLSHSHGLVLAAFSDREAGCDIQKIVSGGEKVAGRFFTEEEQTALREVGTEDGDRLFAKLWTLKESYLKATGEGLRRDLKSFCVLPGKEPAGYFFKSFEMPGFAVSLCLKGEEEDAAALIFSPFQTLADVIE